MLQWGRDQLIAETGHVQNSMLNSCASGLAVVNIDNGFGAGVLAHRINALAAKPDSKRDSESRKRKKPQ